MTTTPELLALQDLCARLDVAGIPYMLTGSLAMSYYARPRMTRDIDLVVVLDSAAVHRLTDALGEDYHADAQAIAEGVRLRRPCNVIHLPTVVKVDLIPRKQGDYRRVEFERRSTVDFAGVELWIASREDLILSKREWARESGSESRRCGTCGNCSKGRWTAHTWRCGLSGWVWTRCSGRLPVIDTTPEIEALLRERYAAMNGAERALMALQMFETAQRIVLSSLPPGMSDFERRRELCRRFYGDDLARQAYPRIGSDAREPRGSNERTSTRTR